MLGPLPGGGSLLTTLTRRPLEAWQSRVFDTRAIFPFLNSLVGGRGPSYKEVSSWIGFMTPQRLLPGRGWAPATRTLLLGHGVSKGPSICLFLWAVFSLSPNPHSKIFLICTLCRSLRLSVVCVQNQRDSWCYAERQTLKFLLPGLFPKTPNK